MNVLGTAAAQMTWTEYRGFIRNRLVVHELVYEDWVVDGIPLRQLVSARPETPRPVQEKTRLCEMWPETAFDGLRRLLGDEPCDFNDGRVALLVCPIDADLGCRALSATLVLDDEAVEWRDVGWQVDYEPFVAADGGFDPPMHFRFHRRAYTELLRALLDRFEKLAAASTAIEKAPRLRSRRR